MRSVSRVWPCLLVLVLTNATDLCQAGASRVDLPASFNPVGSGARALGMGGAFIAVADDATAASWNPAGLVQLRRPELSLVGAYVDRVESNQWTGHPESDGPQSADGRELNFLSLTLPCSAVRCGRDLVFSLNYQMLFDMTRSWDFGMNTDESGLTEHRHFILDQQGSLGALGLSVAAPVRNDLWLGATVNFWGLGASGGGWTERHRERAEGTLGGIPFQGDDRYTHDYRFRGVNANLGVMWEVFHRFHPDELRDERLVVGAVLKTPFTARLKHRYQSTSVLEYPSEPASNQQLQYESTDSVRMDMPMSYGLGLAYRYSDRLMLAADLYRTEWGNFVRTDSAGNETSPVTGEPIAAGRLGATQQFRLGGEYLLVGEKSLIPLRAGLFYDPAPVTGGSDPYYGVALGAGFDTDRWALDIAVQRRFAGGVEDALPLADGFQKDLAETTVYASLIVYLQ